MPDDSRDDTSRSQSQSGLFQQQAAGEASHVWEDDDEDDYLEDTGSRQALLWIGAGLLALIVVAAFVIFGRGSGQQETAQAQAPAAVENSAAAETAPAAAPAGAPAAVADPGLAAAVAGLAQGQKDLAKQMAELSRKLDQVNRELAALSRKAPAPAAASSSSTAAAAPAAKPGTTVAAKPAETPKPGADRKYHTVRSGDTLYSIGKRYGVSVKSIKAINNLSGNNIRLGQKLYLE